MVKIDLAAKYSREFKEDTSINTIDEHLSLCNQKSFVWWGIFGGQINEEIEKKIKSQLLNNISTFLYLREKEDSDIVWKVRLLDIIVIHRQSEKKLGSELRHGNEPVPSYYANNKKLMVWCKITDFQQINLNFLNNLFLVDNQTLEPKDERLDFPGQLSLRYVTEYNVLSDEEIETAVESVSIDNLSGNLNEQLESASNSFKESNVYARAEKARRCAIIRTNMARIVIRDLGEIKCPICGFCEKNKNNKYIFERAHIIPMKCKLNGEDITGPEHHLNCVLLCPNHHTLLDNGKEEARLKIINTLKNEQIHEINRIAFERFLKLKKLNRLDSNHINYLKHIGLINQKEYTQLME